ncbi:MAG TPA: DinB family protein [Gemmatimonadales bacterium]|jgi:hypothetical protein
MKPSFASLADYILEPLQGAPDTAWAWSPDGRWSPGQVVDHLASAMSQSAKGFTERAAKPAMQRRPRTLKEVVAKTVVFRLGWFPGKPQAPTMTIPADQPQREATEARLRAGIEAFVAAERELLPGRGHDLFLKHPRFGDLTLPEFMHFHVRHAIHHRRQIAERVSACNS